MKKISLILIAALTLSLLTISSAAAGETFVDADEYNDSAYGTLFWEVTGDEDLIAGYEGEIGSTLYNLAPGGSAFCVKTDSYVWYEFEAPKNGTYTFACEYVARVGADRAVNYVIDPKDPTNKDEQTLVNLAPCEDNDDHWYFIFTTNLDAGKHTFYICCATGFDDSALKSCDFYGIKGYLTAEIVAEKSSLGSVPQSYADIVVDAQKDDIYAEALVLDISRPLTEGQDETGCRGTGWLLYKDGWLYEYVEVTDPQLFDPDPSKQTDTPWETESVELFVNTLNSDESTDVMQYRIDVQGWPCVYDQNGLADYGPDNVGDAFKYAERAISGGYAVEFAVPLNVAEGTKVGFQNQINDRYNDDESQVQWMTPSSLGSSSWTADLYDYIVIGSMLTPPVVEAAPAPAAEAAPAAAAPAAAAPAPAVAAAAPAAAPVAAQTGDVAAIAVLAAVAALGCAVVVAKKH